MRVHKLATSLLTLVFTLALGMPANADESYEPVGQVELTHTEIGFLISVGGGRGVLKFQGHEYPFRIGGLGIGGTGVHGTQLTGQVYNLKFASDFEGTYSELRSGITLVGAHTGARKLENNKGVAMTLRGTAEGIRLNLGASGLKIDME